MTALITQYHTEIAYIVCAMLGGIMHWIKKYLNKETDAKLSEWYGRNNIAATIYTLTVFFFAIVGSLAADIINSQTSFWAAMYTGFVTGFAIDSGFNRDVTDMNRDLIKTRDELNELYNKEDDDIGRSGISHRGRYQRDDDDEPATEDDEPVKPNRPLSVEERRAELRKKLKGR